MISPEEVRDLLDYNKETGVFKWRKPSGRWGRIPAGTVAGTDGGKGYRVIRIKDRGYKASRLAWLYVTGEWPTDQIDHKNRDRSDDRFENLRPATASQNCANRVRPNISGFKGVHPVEYGKWRAMIRVGGRSRFLGDYSTPEQASAAYERAAVLAFGEFARAA